MQFSIPDYEIRAIWNTKKWRRPRDLFVKDYKTLKLGKMNAFTLKLLHKRRSGCAIVFMGYPSDNNLEVVNLIGTSLF